MLKNDDYFAIQEYYDKKWHFVEIFSFFIYNDCNMEELKKEAISKLDELKSNKEKEFRLIFVHNYVEQVIN
jgi:hypothetical protein